MSAPILCLSDLENRRRFYERGFWRDETIYAIARNHAERTPLAFAIRDRFRRLTYRAYLDRIDALADDLVRRGLRPGERVVTWVSSRIESALIYLACSRGGYVFCPSPDRSHTSADVTALLRRMRASAFFYESGFGADAGRADIEAELASIGTLRHVCRLDPPSAGCDLFPDLRADPSRDPDCIDPDPDKVRYLSFTSGSTGTPKGVMHSDNSLIAVLRTMSVDWGFDAGTVTYALSPISHGLGISGFLTSLSNGGEFVLHDLPRGSSIVERMIETGTGYLVGVPTHAVDLTGELRDRGAAGLERLKCFRISGAAIPCAVVEELLGYGIPVQNGYGMTENCAHQYTRPGDSAARIVESCGKTTACYEVRIFDINDADVPAQPGQIGQVGGKGASLMLGYYGDQAATEASFNSDGWFMTGDLGRQDAEGYLYITGRKKDMIIRGGVNINPGRIEDLAMRHEAVERAAVFPIADQRLGERICLAVMFRGGQSVGCNELLDAMDAAGLSRYELPEFFVALPEIPVMTNGKVRKPDLVRRVQEGEIVPVPVKRQVQ